MRRASAEALRTHAYAPVVHAQEATGAHSVLATPTFFINGVRFDDSPDLATLQQAIERARAAGRSPERERPQAGSIRASERGVSPSPRRNSMAHVVTELDTTVSPERVIRALTDFSPRRFELWPNVERQYFKVESSGDASAEVTEGFIRVRRGLGTGTV